jgi:predicted outer membrane repeat protein
VEFTGATNSSLAVRDTFHVEFIDCMFTQNSGENGSALTIESSEVFITNTSFTGNTAAAFGGAIYMASGDLSVYNSSFVDNHAGDAGGAIYHVEHQLPVVVEAYLEGNSAIYGDDFATPICTADYVTLPATQQSSGQPIRTEDNQLIQVQVLDCYNQRVATAAAASIVFAFTNATSGARQPSTGESYYSLSSGVVTAANLTVRRTRTQK